jgi:hypothetical protein
MQQQDKDMYLHVVEKREDGIIVRGAKSHQTGSLSPTRSSYPDPAMKEDEGDYALSFAIRTTKASSTSSGVPHSTCANSTAATSQHALTQNMPHRDL